MEKLLNNILLLVFYYLCYEGAVDLNDIRDWNQRHALEVQIMEFGQIPKQIFEKPHPPKTCLLIKDFKQFGNIFITTVIVGINYCKIILIVS